MKLKKPNTLKSFKFFVNENFYLIFNDKIQEAFYIKNVAEERMIELSKKHSNVLMKNITLVELKEIYSEEKFNEFISKHKFLKK